MKGAKTKLVYFGETITGTKPSLQKSVLGSSPGEDIGFRNNRFPMIFKAT
jgi:hypothetical protein